MTIANQTRPATSPHPVAATAPATASPGRARWLSTADALLEAVRHQASPGHALISLPGPVSASGAWSDGFEGYARTFLLVAFRVAGDAGRDPDRLLERYAEGLRHGVDPESRERWPRISERRQAVVEAASVAIALSETREWLWDLLDERVRAQAIEWFAEIVGTSGYRNNWLWFQNVVEAFLAEVGGPWAQADLDRNDQLAEDLYVGDGWYSDGRGRDGELQSFDYYAGWAWHVYPLLHSRIRRRPLSAVHRERLSAYLGQARHLVGSRGAPLLQGRSVTYRFAMLAPFWAGAIADATPLAHSETRRTTDAVLDHFLDAGAIGENGLLGVGWHREFRRVRQLYTGGASPYWASKGFLGLLLPPEHPVWGDAARVAEASVEAADTVRVLERPGWLVLSSPSDGIVRVLNHGSDRAIESDISVRADDPFYRRIGYSNVTSPQLTADAIAHPVESHVALLDAEGAPSHRDRIRRVHLSPTAAVSRSFVHWLDGSESSASGDSASWAALRRGPVLSTASVVRGAVEVRAAWWNPEEPQTTRGSDARSARSARSENSIADDRDPDSGRSSESSESQHRRREYIERTAAWPRDTGPWRLRIGGWALAATEPDVAVVDVHTGSGEGGVSVVSSVGVSSDVVSSDALRSSAGALSGSGMAELDRAGSTTREGADPFGEYSVTPWLSTSAPVPAGTLVAAVITLVGVDEHDGLDSSREAGASPGRDRLSPTAVDARDGLLLVTWSDGSTDRVPAPGLFGS